LEPCTYINGILSDNKFHPEHPAWFADSLDEVASTMGINVDDLITLFLSNNPIDRAQAWRMIGDYHGFDNLDSYPEYYTRKEVESRY